MDTKRAFTMVELIFVIVILGILAAVAVPRLNASREDAEAVKLAANIRTFIKDFQSYYAANGTVYTEDIKSSTHWVDVSKVTNVPLANCSSSRCSSPYLSVGGKECLRAFFRLGDDKTKEFLLFVIMKEFYEANEMCQRVLQRPEIKALLNGRSSYGSTYTQINLVDAYLKNDPMSQSVSIPLNAGSVEWE